MPSQIIEPKILTVKAEDIGHGKTKISLELEYEGTANIPNSMIEGEKLSIEIPSHAPPP